MIHDQFCIPILAITKLIPSKDQVLLFIAHSFFMKLAGFCRQGAVSFVFKPQKIPKTFFLIFTNFTLYFYKCFSISINIACELATIRCISKNLVKVFI